MQTQRSQLSIIAIYTYYTLWYKPPTHNASQVVKLYEGDGDDAADADPVEMAEEVARMREHVLREVNLSVVLGSRFT